MSKNVDLINGPIGSSLFKFALPLAVSFVVNMVYAWVDLYYVSHLGEYAMSAVGASERIWFFIFAVGSGFAIGSSVIVSRRIGEGNTKMAKQTASQAIVGMMGLGIILAITLFIFKDFILTILGLEGQTKELSDSYFNGLLFGVPFNLLTFQISMIMRSSGNSIYPMQILLGSNIVNAIVAPMLIFGFYFMPRLEVLGAGIGTSFAQIFSSLWAFYLLKSKFKFFDNLFQDFKIEIKELYRIVKVGFPASLQLITVSITGIVLTANANKFGVNILSTYIIGLKIDMLINMSVLAFGAALEIITGQNLGAGKIKRIFQYHTSAIKQIIYILVPLSLSSFFLGRYVGYLFTDNEYIINHLGIYLKFAAFSNIPFAIGILSIKVISGAGSYFSSLRIVVLMQIILELPLAFALSYVLHSENGIWIAMLSSNLLFCVYGFWSMKRGKWIKRRL
ncbi:MAG TPA: MATE family efflux transporter [Candidatus Kapabacteria bacterium]|nr:MATE family efflux transporter [Candidatus Kapabacteria bacterium]